MLSCSYNIVPCFVLFCNIVSYYKIAGTIILSWLCDSFSLKLGTSIISNIKLLLKCSIEVNKADSMNVFSIKWLFDLLMKAILKRKLRQWLLLPGLILLGVVVLSPWRPTSSPCWAMPRYCKHNEHWFMLQSIQSTVNYCTAQRVFSGQ